MAFLSDIAGYAPELGSVWRYLAAIFLALYATYSFYSWYRLRHIPGPFIASVTKLWLLSAVIGPQMHIDFANANGKYGSLARIGPNDLVTSDPDVMRRMNGVKSRWRRSNWYLGMRFDPRHDNIESMRDERAHAALRSKMAAGYSGKEVENMESQINQVIATFIQLVDKYAVSGSEHKPMDFAEKIQYFTLDVISTIAYSKAFGFVENDTDMFKYIKIVQDVMPAFMFLTVFPQLMYLFQLPIMNKALPSDGDRLGFGKVQGIVKQVVDSRYDPEAKDRKDMLGSFRRHGLTYDEARSEIIITVLGGSDTTATAIRMIMFRLISNPRILAKLRAEVAESAISSPITDKEARRMPYLQAIIKEGLRIWPPVVGLMAKQAPPEGDTINGLFVPGGTRVGYGAHGIFRSKKLWGEDADVYRPERWLEQDQATLFRMEQDLDVVFNRGRFMCLGKEVALMELNKIVVELLRRFDFALVDPMKPMSSVCNGIFTQKDMWMTVRRREEHEI